MAVSSMSGRATLHSPATACSISCHHGCWRGEGTEIGDRALLASCLVFMQLEFVMYVDLV